MAERPDPEIARQRRTAALVIVAAGMLAVAAPWLTKALGLAPHYEILFYLFSLAGFVWSLVVTWTIWQKARK